MTPTSFSMSWCASATARRRFSRSKRGIAARALPDPTKKKPLFPQRMIETNQGKWIPEGTGKLVTDFRAPLRRFHTIFKGIPINECVGGSCSSLGSLSIERWATGALEGPEFQNVERHGGNLGFVQKVPLTNGPGRAFTTDFGAALLRQRTLIPDPVTGKLVPGYFLDLWHEQAKKAPVSSPSSNP